MCQEKCGAVGSMHSRQSKEAQQLFKNTTRAGTIQTSFEISIWHAVDSLSLMLSIRWRKTKPSSIKVSSTLCSLTAVFKKRVMTIKLLNLHSWHRMILWTQMVLIFQILQLYWGVRGNFSSKLRNTKQIKAPISIHSNCLERHPVRLEKVQLIKMLQRGKTKSQKR